MIVCNIIHGIRSYSKIIGQNQGKGFSLNGLKKRPRNFRFKSVLDHPEW